MASVDLSDRRETVEDSTYSNHNNFPGKSQIYVGLEKSKVDLKELLFQREVTVVGVHCMGGGGKTTLALALSNDPQIKGYFGNNVHFITVSESPNLKGILEMMWEKIDGRKSPEFQNVEDAHIQLQQLLILRQSNPTLVILDDVWSRENLDKLLFERPGYKTLITTRDSSTVPKTPSTRLYQLPLLGREDALSLFCFWAFGQISIPNDADANLVKEVQEECDGLPLALKVIGSSLHGESHLVWKKAKSTICQGESISDYHKEGLLKLLETSIDFLDDVTRECFLDLGLFPEDRKICADALLDMWVYVRRIEWHDAFSILYKLARVKQHSHTETTSELYVSLHDVMRDLALYLGGQDNILHIKRLLIPKNENSLLEKWELLNNRAFDVQILTIHTGHMEENQWYEMNFSEIEALLLLFTSNDYFIPPFLKSMKKLKFLMVCNYGPKRATVKGLDVLSSLTQLKSVRLESNLEALPLSIFSMPSAQIWSISNCHLVQQLPYDIGNLSSLRMLRLSALPSLKALPPSIGKLRWLEYLDISVCEGLRELPEGNRTIEEFERVCYERVF
ncbi:hypothetical protein KI387_021341 [Taxus chinensis]|uniref:NB-ARC domain-containing protein n=1 Tax=Taxus chinensis TaxID=29808 RepID=A0AA38GA81_TAXCH|nr:hypothetical protein KI387_021341 [Taxus chinensis]